MENIPFSLIWIALGALVLFSGLVTVKQGYIDVVTLFGKYRRILRPGLNSSPFRCAHGAGRLEGTDGSWFSNQSARSRCPSGVKWMSCSPMK